MKDRVKNWLLGRAKERSTWLSIIGIATAFGLALSPEQKDAIVTIGVTLAGLIGVATKG